MECRGGDHELLLPLYAIIESECSSQAEFQRVLEAVEPRIAEETSGYLPIFEPHYEAARRIVERDLKKENPAEGFEIEAYFVVLSEPFEFSHTSIPSSSKHLFTIPKDQMEFVGSPSSEFYACEFVPLHEMVHAAQNLKEVGPANLVLKDLMADFFAAGSLSGYHKVGATSEFCREELPRHPEIDIPVFGFNREYGKATDEALDSLDKGCYASAFVNAIDLTMGDRLGPRYYELYSRGMEVMRKYCEEVYNEGDSFLHFCKRREEEIVDAILDAL